MTVNDAVTFLILFWALGGVVGWFIGDYRGRPIAGAVLGVLLGVIGWLLIGFLFQPKDKT